MSRSNPTTTNPNPSELWLEWKGKEGSLVWYDKDEKKSVEVKLPFRFLVLDQLNVITGYNKKVKSGIHSNEVRDSRSDPFTVKFFSGEVIANGLWEQIKEKVSYAKGKFAVSCYIAYKEANSLKIGNIRFSGCALGPWFDFLKKNRQNVETKAVAMTRGEPDATGDVEFTPPEFSIMETSKETDEAAKKLDVELQKFLSAYLKRTHVGTVDGGDNLPGEEDYSQDIPWEDKPPLDQRTDPDEEDLERAIPKGRPEPTNEPF